MASSSHSALCAATHRLVRILGLALACVLAGVFVGPWTAPQAPRTADDQVEAIAAHEVLATECQETPVEPEDDEDTVVSHLPSQPPLWIAGRDPPRSHDALGPPTHCPDVETPPPRA
jgi:hypothetical protein